MLELTGVSDERNESWPPAINPPQSPIDNSIYASTATPAFATSRSTPYLRPPLPSHASLPRSNSTRTHSVSSKGTSSTNVTHPSSHPRGITKRTQPKSARRQLYCPDCKKDIKNGFEKHFRDHLDDLVGSSERDFEQDEAFGCGYCFAQGVIVEGGKVFHGTKTIVRHVKDEHASAPQRLHWDISHSFNHVLSSQHYFRRKILGILKEKQESVNDTSLPSLSWSPDHRPLLRELQIVSGQLDRDPSRYEYGNEGVDNLLMRVYEAAAQNWKRPVTLTSLLVSQQIVPQRLPQLNIPPQQPRPSSSDFEFTGIGQRFDTPTRKHESFASNISSPSILSPLPQVPQISLPIPRTLQPWQDASMTDADASSYGAPSIPDVPDLPTPIISFDGHSQYATPPPSQLYDDSFEGMCADLNIDQTELYSTQGDMS